MPSSAASRQNMILGQLSTNEVADPRILQAISETPREPFLPESLRGAAYVDEDIEILPGRYQLAPLTFTRLVQLAELTPSCRVLTIGCLTGYGAAIISRLAGHVVATDIDANVLEEARAHMRRLNIGNVHIQLVPSLADGCAAAAPYDAIIIQGAIRDIPQALRGQLAIDARLTAIRNIMTRPDMPGGLGKMLLIRRLDDELQYREYFDAAAALLPGFTQPTSFVF